MRVDFERYPLENGLVLLVYPRQNLPLVSISGSVLVGTDQNPFGSPGCAALTARMLDEGTQRYAFRQISALVEDVGGDLSTFSQRELSGVCLELGSEHLVLGLELLEQLLCRPIFPRDRFERERQIAISSLQSLEDDPPSVASGLLNRSIYGGGPLQYPTLGTVGSLRGLRVEDLRSFHRRKYAPQNSTVVVVGEVQPDQVLEHCRRLFSDWNTPDYERSHIPPLKRQESRRFERKHMPKEQVHIFVGHLGVTRNNRDFPALEVLDVVLGSGPGFTSRIPRRLRDEQGLAYSTSSDLCSSSGLYPGRFAAYICTSMANRTRALEALLAEVLTLVDHGVTEEELSMAQDFLTGSFAFHFQSNDAIARFLTAIEVLRMGRNYTSEYADRIRAVTSAEVERVARQYLDTINYTGVVVGPLDGKNLQSLEDAGAD